MYTQLSLLFIHVPHETMVRSHMPSARAGGGTRAGAAVVAIGVGSPVAGLGADGRRRRGEVGFANVKVDS